MRKIVYIGNSVEVVYRINDINEVKIVGILCDFRKASDKMLAFTKDNGIKYIICSDSKQVDEALDTLYFDYAIMYSFGLILSDNAIINHQIYNFHPGDLYSNRGSTPVNWSIVLGDDNTKIVLYRLSCAGVDLGEIVSERTVEIDNNDNVVSLREKMECHIPRMLLELFDFIDRDRKGVIVEAGIYRPRISEKDYTIDEAVDSEKIIRRKIKSQETYDGAIIRTSDGNIRIKSWEQYVTFSESGIVL